MKNGIAEASIKMMNPMAQERRPVCNETMPPTRQAKVINAVTVESKMHILARLGRFGFWLHHWAGHFYTSKPSV
ncbi:MAG: hypothetical protein J4O09_13410 [Chloroflexi bacterium]|nr:hypothetical protein [Chloroflexota bacterium]